MLMRERMEVRIFDSMTQDRFLSPGLLSTPLPPLLFLLLVVPALDSLPIRLHSPAVDIATVTVEVVATLFSVAVHASFHTVSVPAGNRRSH